MWIRFTSNVVHTPFKTQEFLINQMYYNGYYKNSIEREKIEIKIIIQGLSTNDTIVHDKQFESFGNKAKTFLVLTYLSKLPE